VSGRGHIKGAAFGEFVAWYAVHGDAAELREAIDHVELEHPGTFDPDRDGFGILSSRWYPAELVHALLDRIVEGKPATVLQQIADRAARDIMTKTLSGVYRFLFSTFATPERYARHAGRLWEMHYDSGEISIEAVDGGWRSRISGWGGHHPFICRLNMAATVPIYEAMGCRDVSYRRLACVSDGAPACESRVKATPPRSR
jgi:hypothetical protein